MNLDDLKTKPNIFAPNILVREPAPVIELTPPKRKRLALWRRILFRLAAFLVRCAS